jgi:glycerol-3-phosphate dehydrogenase
MVVNAGGPWVDKVLEGVPAPVARHIGGTKGSHIIVNPFAGAPRDAFYVEAAADGRPFFIIPWNGQYLIGTTDIRYDGDLDTVRASDAEVDYLLAETNRVFPQAILSKTSINYAYAGIRPLPYQDKGPESAITRKHIIKVNEDVAKGLISIIGGKLTTYRSLAEQTVDKIAKLKHLKLPACRTGDTLLPGAQGLEQAERQLRDMPALSKEGVKRLLSIYGGRAAEICDLARGDNELARTLDPAATVLAAEIVFAVRSEFAKTLADIVFRRCMLGLDSDQGRPLYAAIADVAAAELGWDAAEKNRQLDALVEFSDSLRIN